MRLIWMRWMAALWVAGTGGAWASVRGPLVEHTPVQVTARGQPLTVRARVRENGRPVKSVTLFYSTSRDAAPFEVPMQDTGAGMYIGTIPANMFQSLSSVLYYLAAEDTVGESTDTPWATVRVQGEAPAGGADDTPKAGERPRWVTPALIAGGAAAVIGGAVLLSDSGGNDSGSGGSSADHAGDYTGAVELTMVEGAGAPVTTRHGADFTVGADGTIVSANLHTGQNLTGHISGGDFVLRATVDDGGFSGDIRYLASIGSGRIAGGNIVGSATNADGVKRAYSGSFSAVRN